MRLKSILEGALLAVARPLTLAELGNLFEEGSRPEQSELQDALAELAADCAERGVELCEVASGWRMQVRREVAPWIARLSEEKAPKYSRALLETLAIIAYRQPITRADIEEIRGVAVNPNIVRTLQERDWVRVVGHRDVPGRPELLATTRQFLDYFSLRSLENLPALSEIKDFEQINPAVPLAIAPGDDSTAGAAGDLAAGYNAGSDEDAVRGAALARDLAGWSELSSAEFVQSTAEPDPFDGEDAFEQMQSEPAEEGEDEVVGQGTGAGDPDDEPPVP